MPFSKNPFIQTYSTKVIKLMQEWETRDKSGTKDNDTVNCFYEIVKNKATGENDHYVISRAGTTIYPSATSSANVRGIYYLKTLDFLYVAVDTTVFVYQGATGVQLAAIAPGFAMGMSEVGFTEFGYDTGIVQVVVTDGTVLGVIDGVHTFTRSIAGAMPVPHLPCPVFLDGFLFLCKTNTANIYNSNLNDPLNYTAGSYTTAETFPDNILKITRLNNYILAFGTSSLEYFYDAATPTGSPLLRYDAPVKLLGYRGGLAHWGNKLIFVGDTDTTSTEVILLDDLKMETLGKPPIRRLAESNPAISGAMISFSGHDFYVVTVGSLTYMVDVLTKLWTRLKYKQSSSFPILFATIVPINNTGCSVFWTKDNFKLSYFNADVFYDDSVDFTPTIVTDTETFDSHKHKFGGRLFVYADRPTDSNIFVDISWSDDDYQTWSVPRRVFLNQESPLLTQLGSFRRRAHKIVHTGFARMRIRYLEMDVNMGAR